MVAGGAGGSGSRGCSGLDALLFFLSHPQLRQQRDVEHPLGLTAHEADLLVLSPGVPVEIEVVLAARELSVPVWGEVELAARFTRGRVLGITGSNGKSTVTAMTSWGTSTASSIASRHADSRSGRPSVGTTIETTGAVTGPRP